MKTIEERAESANPNNPHGDNYEVGQYFGFMDGYETGATEQRQIDIDKACEIVTEIVEDILARSCETWSEYNKTVTLNYVRKSMKE